MDKKEYPLVSVIIPCRNEEKHIGKCLDSIIANDYPKDSLEILIADGMSLDHTRAIVNHYVCKHANIRLIDNPGHIVSTAMNIGIRQARGEIIIKMDAHSTFLKDYISCCVKSLQKYDVANVGGRFMILPDDDTLLAKCIALGMADAFGQGKYYTWMRSLREPTEVDTVSFGCFKKELISRLGIDFNEQLVRGEDVEFNLRLKRAGYKIILIPNIQFYYHARSNLRSLFKYQINCGIWAARGVRHGLPLTLRARVPASMILISFGMFLVSFWDKHFLWLLLFLLSLYTFVNMMVSAKVALTERSPRCLLVMPVVFLTFHLGHGMGLLYGFLKMVR